MTGSDNGDGVTRQLPSNSGFASHCAHVWLKKPSRVFSEKFILSYSSVENGNTVTLFLKGTAI